MGKRNLLIRLIYI